MPEIHLTQAIEEFVLKIVADYALDSTEANFSETVNAITDGGVNVCVEVTGLGSVLVQAMDCMKWMGMRRCRS